MACHVSLRCKQGVIYSLDWSIELRSVCQKQPFSGCSYGLFRACKFSESLLIQHSIGYCNNMKTIADLKMFTCCSEY